MYLGLPGPRTAQYQQAFLSKSTLSQQNQPTSPVHSILGYDAALLPPDSKALQGPHSVVRFFGVLPPRFRNITFSPKGWEGKIRMSGNRGSER